MEDKTPAEDKQKTPQENTQRVPPEDISSVATDNSKADHKSAKTVQAQTFPPFKRFIRTVRKTWIGIKLCWRSLRNPAISNRLITVATIAIALATIATFVDVHIGGKDTHDLALAAKLDQRAWVAYGVLIVDAPKIGDVAHASVSYINTGRTPAKNVSPVAHLRFMPELITSEAQLIDLAKEGGSPSPMFGVMYPGIPYPAPIEGKAPINEIDKTTAEDGYSYLWGELTYTDVFNDTHPMTWCGYRKGTAGAFLQCPFHNDPGYQENPN